MNEKKTRARQPIVFIIVLLILLACAAVVVYLMHGAMNDEPAPLAHLPQPADATSPLGNYSAAFEMASVSNNAPERFTTAIAVDPMGRLWVGKENLGAWRFDQNEKTWTHFSSQNGLADDGVACIAFDRKGRTWLGHFSHGVSVFNGDSWKTYDAPNGPLGGRVTRIAIGPDNGEVWLATDRGVSRYSPSSDAWSYITRADGLPSDETSAIAFDVAGNAYVATLVAGIAIANASDNFHSWRAISGPERLPTDPAGDGLPSNLVNDLLVARDGTVYAGTAGGVARSEDHGQNWHFNRGKDWHDKVVNRIGGPPAQWSPTNEAPLLLEDYVSCLAEDSAGNIWIGHRRTEMEMLPHNASRTKPIGASGRGLILSICCPAGLPALAATYGRGILATDSRPSSKENPLTKSPAGTSENSPPFPSVATSLAAEALRTEVKAISAPNPQGVIAFYEGEDPATWGDRDGKYGNEATFQPQLTNEVVSQDYQYYTSVGPHQDDSATLYPKIVRANRFTYDADDNSSDPRALFDAVTGRRQQLEWNDGSWQTRLFSNSFEGPDLWISVTLPAGVHRVSLYFVNNDRNSAGQGSRDYVVELKNWVRDLAAAEAEPPLASTRVHQFWSPVYKRFVVSGGQYWFKIARNYSECTKCSAVFVDRYDDGVAANELNKRTPP